MKVRLGYACISNSLKVTCSTPYTYTAFQKEHDFKKLENIISSNLEALNEIIDYNIKNNIHFFRISSSLIPLATKEDVEFEYIKNYQKNYDQIKEKIKKHSMRVDFHPNQFCVLNSTKEEVIKNSILILKYHYSLLEALGIEEKVLVLHVGSSVFGKKKSIDRFIYQFNLLSDNLKKCIVIENDDKVFTIEDCLKINAAINVPVVLDYHHYVCNQSSIDFEKVLATWHSQIPKIHFSSPKNKKEFRSHHDYINSDDFINFIELIKKYQKDIDIMIEAKMKDDALFRLVRELKYKTNYKFIDETTFIVK
jgi:UV DNA damage endonuclease